MKDDTNRLYVARKERIVHPHGTFDKGGRWYPSDEENSDNYTDRLRSPSRGWPYSYMSGARTKKHCKALAKANPEFFQQLLEELDQRQAYLQELAEARQRRLEQSEA